MLTKLKLRNEFMNAADSVSEDLVESVVFDFVVNEVVTEVIRGNKFSEIHD